ncbi:hypothetical protein [Desulfotomaculum sp. 1211_IL3151]|uniref:hypothetical protein n=1 Tax=Desulfotomaculum sp. 1211_IL3151 TaxID=3084055 RepID=UPI002FD91102
MCNIKRHNHCFQLMLNSQQLDCRNTFTIAQDNIKFSFFAGTACGTEVIYYDTIL